MPPTLNRPNLQLHFEGSLAREHRIPLRYLAKSLYHTQCAIGRAYLDIEKGGVHKHAKVKIDDLAEIEFLVPVPQNGGFILDLLAASNPELAQRVLKRIADTLSQAMKEAQREGSNNIQKLSEVAERKKLEVVNEMVTPISYQDLIKGKMDFKRSYGDRSIAKEFDQIASIVRRAGDSTNSIEISITSQTQVKFKFDLETSKAFHKVVAAKTLAEPVLYSGKVTELNSKSQKGIILIEGGKQATINFPSEQDFILVRNYLGEDRKITFIGCPLVEYGSFDPKAGDIYFIRLIE